MMDVKATILAFAAHLEGPMTDPMTKALQRDWLDQTGAPTADGIALVSALTDQDGTRTVFRNIA